MSPACEGGRSPRLLAAAAMFIAACSASPAAEIPVDRLRADAPYSLNSGLSDAGQYVIRNAAEWQALWMRIHSRRRPVPPLPAVDFGVRMVVVVALGRQTTGGFSITVGGATREGELIVVKIVQQSPGPGCAVTTGLTEPVDIAVLPRDDHAVSFEFEARINPCP